MNRIGLSMSPCGTPFCSVTKLDYDSSGHEDCLWARRLPLETPPCADHSSTFTKPYIEQDEFSQYYWFSTLKREVLFTFLIAALIFSAGYYSAPIFTIQELDCIGALSFYSSKNLNCIGALSFYDSKRSIGEVLFFNQFYWSEF